MVNNRDIHFDTMIGHHLRSNSAVSKFSKTKKNSTLSCDGRLKMATGRKFSLSGINSGHHYLPPYQILMILDNVVFFFVFENFETAE
jgi:hypothetical protein